ncbi:MAG: hypothetical protein HYZ53_20285 [Planctomycetes bacterium]|nr:hypothetical protein [Planctomycetota bacterium]
MSTELRLSKLQEELGDQCRLGARCPDEETYGATFWIESAPALAPPQVSFPGGLRRRLKARVLPLPADPAREYLDREASRLAWEHPAVTPLRGLLRTPSFRVLLYAAVEGEMSLARFLDQGRKTRLAPGEALQWIFDLLTPVRDAPLGPQVALSPASILVLPRAARDSVGRSRPALHAAGWGLGYLAFLEAEMRPEFLHLQRGYYTPTIHEVRPADLRLGPTAGLSPADKTASLEGAREALLAQEARAHLHREERHSMVAVLYRLLVGEDPPAPIIPLLEGADVAIFEEREGPTYRERLRASLHEARVPQGLRELLVEELAWRRETPFEDLAYRLRKAALCARFGAASEPSHRAIVQILMDEAQEITSRGAGSTTGLFEDALAHLSGLLSATPKSAKLYQDRVRIALHLAQEEERSGGTSAGDYLALAIADADAAVSLDREDWTTFWLRATALQQKLESRLAPPSPSPGRVAGAPSVTAHTSIPLALRILDDCGRVVERNPGFVDAGLLATRAFELERERLPQPEAAAQQVEELLSRLLQHNPRSPKLLLARACLFERLHKFGRAVDDLSDMIQANAGTGITYMYRARMRRYAVTAPERAPDDAVSQLQEALKDLIIGRKLGAPEAECADQERKILQALRDLEARQR